MKTVEEIWVEVNTNPFATSMPAFTQPNLAGQLVIAAAILELAKVIQEGNKK